MSKKDKSFNLKKILLDTTEFKPEDELSFNEIIDGIGESIIGCDDEQVRSLMRIFHRKVGADIIAQKMGIKRESLIRMTSKSGNPTLRNITKFIKAAKELIPVAA